MRCGGRSVVGKAVFLANPTPSSQFGLAPALPTTATSSHLGFPPFNQPFASFTLRNSREHD